MRFIAAIIAFVIAFGMIAFGLAQRTIFADANSVTATAAIRTDATVTVIDSKTLRALDGRQNVQISGSKKVFAAYGRTSDVMAWVGDAGYNRIGFAKSPARLTNRFVPGKTVTVPNPQGSDLWLGEYSRADSLDFTVNVPAGISLVVVSDGKQPAPSQVAIRWPLDTRTPWSGPLIVGGIVLLIIGLVLYILALNHVRRSRGPRRKSQKMPKVPRQRGYRRRSRAISATPRRRPARRRMIAAVPVVLVGALALGGCSAQSWPEFMTGGTSATPTPTPSSTTTPVAETPPAVTVPQLRDIISRISAVATKADAAKDVDLAKTRFEGAALDLRAANYAIRKVDDTYHAPDAIPSGNLSIKLPQQTSSWPRTVFTVVANPDDKTVPPTALMIEQKTPRSDYKVTYAVALEAKAEVPELAPENVGAPRLKADAKILKMAPSKVALAYGDIVDKGLASEYYKQFDETNDALIGIIGSDAPTTGRKALKAALPATAAMTFANSDGPYETITLGSYNSGAIVAAYLNETVTVTPVEAGASVNPEGAVKSLSGVTGTTKGTVAVYGDQLLFFVPSATSKGDPKISLLGFATGLVSAKEIP